jgi:lipoprotein signal peptidase
MPQQTHNSSLTLRRLYQKSEGFGLVLACIIALFLQFSTSVFGYFATFGLFSVTLNYHPAVFFAGGYWAIGFFVFAFVLSKYLKLYHKYKASYILIFAGLLSNYWEMLTKGFVVDYLNLGIGVVNLADILIYWGIFLIILGKAQTIQSNK